MAKKIKIQVNKKQESLLWDVSKLLTNLYNCGLEQRIRAYREHNISVSVFAQKLEIPAIRKELPEYQLPFARLLHETLLMLDRAYKGFFTRVKKGADGNKGYPRFRSQTKFFTMPIEKQYVKIKDNYFYYKFGNKSNIAPIKLKLTEIPPKNYGMVYLTHNHNGFYISFSYEKVVSLKRNNKDVIALDLGVKRLVTGVSTTGKPYFCRGILKNQMFFAKIIDKLRRKRDKKKLGSCKWRYYMAKLNKLRLLKSNKTQDFLHKISYNLTNKFVERTIVCGDLKIKSMVQKGNKWLNRNVQNESLMYAFTQKLKYKSNLYGKDFYLIDESYTSKLCSCCNNKKSMPLSKRIYKCEYCGYEEDRDYNSARNILKRFLAQSELPVAKSEIMF